MHCPMRDVWQTARTELVTEVSMTVDGNADLEAAMQYLAWALEQIEKMGNHEAARHACLALEALRKSVGSDDERAT